jgi:NodT family efflux transporter outer membrane factor (OMF) lipoprotein
MFTLVSECTQPQQSGVQAKNPRHSSRPSRTTADYSACENIHAAASRAASGVLVAFSLMLAGCRVGPRYVRPQVQVPAAYKEANSSDPQVQAAWRKADPKDDANRGQWWEVFNDPQLNTLERKVDVSNQNIAAASASFLAARAAVRQARSQYFPSIVSGPTITKALPSPGQFGGLQSSAGHGFSVNSFTNYSLPLDASWEPDLWSHVRLAVRTNYLAAQVSAADLENVRLSVHAELAVDYYELRGQGSLKRLLDSTVAAYREALEMAQVQYKAGIGNDEAIASAETQLEAAEAQDTNLSILRAQYEHAIAVLVGQPASTFSLPPQALEPNPPDVPAGVPSELLERRPDIAAAERSVAQSNAQIGVAKAAFFPNLLLGATGGFGNTSIADWLTWPGRFWSLGPGLTETLFDAGLRRATVQQYQASHQQAVANYRQTVLTAFQQVEDNLAALRILSEDIEQQEAAILSAERNLQGATARYKAGLDPYLNVITARTLLLNTQQTAVTFRVQQMVASVQLVEALGGDWSFSRIPSLTELTGRSVSNPKTTGQAAR